MQPRFPSLALLAVLLVGCASATSRTPNPSPIEAPVVAKVGEVVRAAKSAKVEPGATTSIEIGTHCGVGKMPIDFDGSFWIPAAELPERIPGLGNPTDRGEIRLTGPNTATYVSGNGPMIDLVRVDPGPRVFALCR